MSTPPLGQFSFEKKQKKKADIKTFAKVDMEEGHEDQDQKSNENHNDNDQQEDD